MDKSYRPYYRRKLPHILPLHGCFSVTFRLAGSIPRSAVQALQHWYQEKKAQLESGEFNSKEQFEYAFQLEEAYFRRVDVILDGARYGPAYLKDSNVAELVRKKLHQFDGEMYDLLAYVVMSNHVHALLDLGIQAQRVPGDQMYTLSTILHRIKGGSAFAINRYLGRSGRLWEHESYDRYIRHQRHLENTIQYIVQNPAAAGLVRDWEQWPHVYLKGW